jgi:hypothetical protein
MKLFRKAASKPFVVIPLISAMLIFSTSCQQTHDTQVASYTGEELFRGIFFMQGAVASKITLLKKIKQEYSFEEDNEVVVQYNHVINEVIDVMKSKSNNFFHRFKVAIESGDHMKVKGILDESAELVHASLLQAPTVARYYQDALDISYELDVEGLINADGTVNLARMDDIDKIIAEKTKNGKSLSSRTQACSLIAVCVVWIYVAAIQSAAVGVSIAAAVAVAVYAGVYLWTVATVWSYKQKVSTRSSEQEALQKELLIHEITMTFSAV